jgi:hypothetical protein
MASNANYVRFIRGTPTAWANLKNRDEDVLYFISEKGSDKGSLYLGSKLIAGDGYDPINITTSLGRLEDVSLKLKISNGDLLVYDKLTQKWVNKSPASLIKVNEDGSLDLSDYALREELEDYAKVEALKDYAKASDIPGVMVGATEMFFGEPGLVPRPQAGEQSYYLRGDGKWVPQDTRWEAALAVLYGVDPNTKSIREISHEEVAAIYGTNVPEAYNTVEKIAAWILRNGASLDGQNVAERLDTLEKASFGEDKTSSTSGAIYAIQQLNQAVYGNKDIGVVGLISKTNRLEGQVTDLEGTVTNILNKYNTLNTTVSDLDGRLTWKSML